MEGFWATAGHDRVEDLQSLPQTLTWEEQLMRRKFIDADHEAALEMRVRIGDVLPATHLAR